jgi:hypothetical protein
MRRAYSAPQPARRLGVVTRRTKPAKIISLIEKDFCARLLKMFQFLRALLCADAQAEPLPTPSPASRDCERPKISSLQTHLHFSPGGFTNKEKFDNIFQDLFIQNRKEG